MALMLTIVKDTWLKVSQAQSADLAEDQKHFVAVGQRFLLLDCEREDNHVKVTLSLGAAQPFSGRSIWYVYFPHVEVWQDGKKLNAGDKRPDRDTPPHGSGGGGVGGSTPPHGSVNNRAETDKTIRNPSLG